MTSRQAGRTGLFRHAAFVACVVVLSLATPRWARGDTEVTTHCVGKYADANGSSYCAPGYPELPNALNDCVKFFDGGGFASIYDQYDGTWEDQQVDGRDFTDATQYSFGADSDDNQGTDYADVVFYSGHAVWSASTNSAYIYMGDNNAGETCSPRVGDDNASNRHMEFGNGGTGEEADAFVTFTCATAQHEVWELDGFNLLSHSAGQFNILNGFHGIVYEVSGYQTDLKNYATDAQYNSIGDAWIDRMYTNNASGSDDNCPVPMLYGANTSETNDYYLNAGWLDFHNTGSRSGDKPNLMYVCDCNPTTGEALPPC